MQNYIKIELIPSYEHAVRLSEAYPEYSESFRDNAKQYLQYIINYYGYIASDLAKLAECSDGEGITEEELLTLLNSIYADMTSDKVMQTFQDSEKKIKFSFDMVKYHKGMLSYLQMVNKLEKKMQYDGLLDKMVTSQSGGLGSAYASLTSVIDFQQATFNDLMKYRGDSLENSSNNLETTILTLDRLNSIYLDFKDYPKKTSIKVLDKESFAGHGLKLTGAKFWESLQRGLWTEGLMLMFSQNVPATELEFLEDFAGNFAAITTAGNRLGLLLVYAELNADIMNHVTTSLDPVFKDADENYKEFLKYRQQQDAAYAVELANASVKIVEAKLNSEYTNSNFTNVFLDTVETLDIRAKEIYDLDPKAIKIYLDGRMLHTTEPPYIEKGTTMVPLRLIAEGMGVEPKWNPDDRTITITTDRVIHWKGRKVDIIFTIGSKAVKLHTMNVEVDVAPVIKSGTTFVPLRFIAESLSLNVKWVPESNSIVLTSRR